jgi:hypothetical protein
MVNAAAVPNMHRELTLSFGVKLPGEEGIVEG